MYNAQAHQSTSFSPATSPLVGSTFSPLTDVQTLHLVRVNRLEGGGGSTRISQGPEASASLPLPNSPQGSRTL